MTDYNDNSDASVHVDFGRKIRPWDGFGVNYVELAQSPDYQQFPQEYGGLSLLSEKDREEVIELIFGEDGLRPGTAKMFLDPFHQNEPGSAFDHETTTRWMRFFMSEGLKRVRSWGGDLEILATLYGPPAWATKQRLLNSRDLDREQWGNLALYMGDWVKFLRESEGLPIRHLGMHNEGDNPLGYPRDGGSSLGKGADYNAYWSADDVAEFVIQTRPILDEMGLKDVSLACGENSSWASFFRQQYAWALRSRPDAMEALGLVTSHSFEPFDRLAGAGVKLLKETRPDLHAWTTSFSWGGMNTWFIEQIVHNINKGKVNGMIPWACIQHPPAWVGGDPNPGKAIHVSEDGSYEVLPGYYLYKQVTRAGQAGTAVVAATSDAGGGIDVLGFAGNGTRNPDSFVVVNKITYGGGKRVAIRINGTDQNRFRVFRTTRKYGNETVEKYKDLGVLEVRDGWIDYEAPGHSVATFFAE